MSSSSSSINDHAKLVGEGGDLESLYGFLRLISAASRKRPEGAERHALPQEVPKGELTGWVSSGALLTGLSHRTISGRAQQRPPPIGHNSPRRMDVVDCAVVDDLRQKGRDATGTDYVSDMSTMISVEEHSMVSVWKQATNIAH